MECEQYAFKNWQKYQSFNHKRPVHSWKKLHVAVLDDYDFAQLEEFEQARFFKMILLADPATGSLPARAEEIEFKLKIGPNDPPFDLGRFSKFLVPLRDLLDTNTNAGNIPVDYRQTTCPEKRRVEKSRVEKTRKEETPAREIGSLPTRDGNLEILRGLVGNSSWFEFASLYAWYHDTYPSEFLALVNELQGSNNPAIAKSKGLTKINKPGGWFVHRMKAHMTELGRKLPSTKQLTSP